MEKEHDINFLKTWIGKSEITKDYVDLRSVNALAATLDYDYKFSLNDPIPLLWHFLFFWKVSATLDLFSDGHAPRGDLIPPIQYPRRMWAGGRLNFFDNLTVGTEVDRKSTIKDINFKKGKTGKLAFVCIKHDYISRGKVLFNEEQDIVYREEISQSSISLKKNSQASINASWKKKIFPTSVLLFRYSALTFNTHKIHYDFNYSKENEGYPDIVVHGPLIATYLIDLLRKNVPQKKILNYNYRAISPLFCNDYFNVYGRFVDDKKKLVELWASNSKNELAMKANAELV